VKKLGDLTNDDLRGCPIWRYEGDSDYTALVSPSADFTEPDQCAYIARTRFELADGSEWWGYCSPTDDSGLDYLQPVIITPDGVVRFWYDKLPTDHPEPARACRLLGRLPEQIFPVRFQCAVPFKGQRVAGELTRIDF